MARVDFDRQLPEHMWDSMFCGIDICVQDDSMSSYFQ